MQFKIEWVLYKPTPLITTGYPKTSEMQIIKQIYPYFLSLAQQTQ